MNNTITFWDTEDDKNIKAKLIYSIDEESYCLEVTCYNPNGADPLKVCNWKRKGFEPRFGVDVIDMNHAYSKAEEYAKK